MKLAVLLLIGSMILNVYFYTTRQQPVLYFNAKPVWLGMSLQPPPLARFGENPEELYISKNKHWLVRCLYIDGSAGIVQPNYGDPNCAKPETRKEWWKR